MNTTFPISASLFPAKVRHAVDEYWHGRVSQASRQQRRGVREPIFHRSQLPELEADLTSWEQ